MKLIKILGLGLAVMSVSVIAAPENAFEPGDQVLTNCHQIYTKGVIQGKVEDGYRVHFDKSARPIRCPPFRWHSEFVEPFGSVSEYQLNVKGKGFFAGNKVVEFKVGEPVTLWLEPDKRMVKNSKPVAIQAEITDISAIGAIAVNLTSTDPVAVATFWQWVGTNYVDLNHEALAAERQKRAE